MELSVIVPTYNEVENIRPLAERLFKACKKANLKIELLIMDDESIGSEKTAQICEELKRDKVGDIRLHGRKKAEGRGLSSAVLLGFSLAKYETLLCMDADLQHEPESVPNVATPVLKKQAEFTVGSRYCHNNGIGFHWSLLRRVISHGATLLAIGVSKSSDPMSGFFCTTKSVIMRGNKNINPIGFKIGLEIMVRCRADPVIDVPITFRERTAGESKLSMKQNVLYVQQLMGLYWDRFAFFIMFFIAIALSLIGYKLTGIRK